MIEGEIFNKAGIKPRILVAPLEWGLGHATRCIPIIRELINLDCIVIIAAEGSTENLLKAEFPKLAYVKLNGYRLRYNRRRSLFMFKLFIQIPRIIYTIYTEHFWLKKIVNDFNIDAVISDNRFGLFHYKIPTIYITHQVRIKTGRRLTDRWAKSIHQWFIKKYTICWIPDFESAPGIAGELSHGPDIPSNAQYIGCLSRFEHTPEINKKYDLLFCVSGPEPQRSIFENLLVGEAKNFEGKILLVRGLPGKNIEPLDHLPNMVVRDHLTASELNEALQSAPIIISRSGYTSVMDYLKLGCKAILVPTPGQKEQEYLADILSAQNFFITSPQEKFSLEHLVNKGEHLHLDFPKFDMNQYKKAVAEFVGTLR